MGSDLNDIRAPYQDFRTDETPRYTEQMPLLIADGRNPITVAQVMERRLHSERPAWKDEYFDTGDAVVYSTDKDKFKVVRSAPFLRDVTPQSRLSSGALVLADNAYTTVDGAEFSRKDLKAVLGRDLVAADVKKHPVWQYVVGDQALLDEYTDRMFAEMGTRFSYNDAMGTYLANAQKVPTARALFVGRLVGRSQLRGRLGLDGDDGQLVGVAPEALGASGVIIQHSLETSLAIVNRHLGTELTIRRK